MIKLNSYKKYDILYKNYIKQFSKAYISGSHLYVGNSLNNASYIKKLYIENFIKTYSKNFIKLYMTNNKVHNELYRENLCIICLEDLNENITDICHKCNVKCHNDCITEWYIKNKKKVCPICLKSEAYYLNILKNSDNIDENIENNLDNNLQNNLDNNLQNNLENVLYIQRYLNWIEICNKLSLFCLVSVFTCILFFLVIYF
tara:strand:- start:432 stop:1037 length:606 start_codon:yes stop_codon:yes gene_type:complete